MHTTRRLQLGTIVPIVISIISIASSAQAQWLTRADEGPSARQERPHQKANNEKELGRDAGIADAMKWYWGQRTFGLGYIPKDALHNAYAQTNALRAQHGKGASAQAAAPQWTLVGPTDAGGRIESVAIDPTDPNTVYVGSANGGVWKTTDGGNNWVPLTDQQESLAMGSLAIDPENRNIIFAGTGEFPSAGDCYPGYGLLRSSDAGKTWTNVGPTSVASYSRIIVNPKHSNLVYAAAGRSGGGILRSTDGGLSWLWVTDTTFPQNTSVSDLALSMKGDVAVLYAGVPGKGVYQSTNGGDKWQLLTSLSDPNSTQPPFLEMARISVDVDPKDWQSVVALSVNNSGGGAGQDDLESIQYSQDGGATWTSGGDQFKTAPSAGPFYEGAGTPPQGWYDCYIRADPSDFTHWLVGGVPFWSTHNSGSTWTEDRNIHVDHHDAAFAPSDPTQVYVGCDGGVFYSSTGADQFNSTLPMNIPNSEFYGIGIDQSQPELTYGGLQDNGLVKGSSPANWAPFGGGDGGYTAVDPNHPSRIFFSIAQQLPFVSQDAGATANQVTAGIKSPPDAISWLNPFCIDPKNNIIFYGLDHLYYMPTSGSSWTRNKQPLYKTGDTGVTIQAIDAFGDGQTVVCGTSGGNVFITNNVTTNNGKNFTDVSAGLPGRSITSVKFNPSTKTTFYATCSGFGAGHVFKTTDNGAHWLNISSTLPDIPVNSIKMDPTNSNVLYIGTDVGVFFSPDTGAVWLPYGIGLPNVAVDFMDIQTTNRVLRAGTHGRSVWEVPIDDDQTGIVLPAQRSVWTVGDTASIQWRGFGEAVTVELSLDGGTSWQSIAKNVGGTAYKISNVQYQTSENALVRISDGNNTLISPLFTVVQQYAGNEVGTIGEYTLYLYDIAYDKDDNVLWGTNFNPVDNHIYKIDPDLGTVLDSVPIQLIDAASREGFTGIKYDPVSKNLFIHQVNGPTTGPWTSDIYEVTTSGTVIQTGPSPANYGTGIFVRGDTLLAVDRMGPGSGSPDPEQISRAFTSDWNFTDLNPLPINPARNAIYGPRGLTYDPKLDKYLLAYTDFQGSLTASALNGSYILFLNPETGENTKSLSIVEGGSGITNMRGMEYDPRGSGTTVWATVLTGSSSAKIVKIALTDGPSAAPAAAFSTTPGVIDFGNVDTGKSKTQHVYIHNTGSVSGTIQSIAFQPPSSEFSIGTVTLPATVGAGDSLGVDVTFSSHSMGSQNGTLVVTPSGADAIPASFTVEGFGTVNGAGVSDGSAYGWSLELSPNPARDYVEVDLGVERTTVAEIKIFDVTGREVRSLSLGALSAGDHTTDIPTTDLQSGIYFVRVTGSNGEVAAARLAIEK